MTGYVYDNSWEQEHARLTGLEALYDIGTVRHLEALGIQPGWRCLEVGAGAGSIAVWLCDKVTAAGSVVATDVDTRFLQVLKEPNLDIRHHNLDTDDLPEREFDLVHGRAVLEYVTHPEEAISGLARALKPGGWIILEDSDFTPMLMQPDRMILFPETHRATLAKVYRGIVEVLRKNDFTEDLGRRLPSLLIGEGLVDVGADVRSALVWGGSPASASAIGTIERFQDDLMSSFDVTDDEIDQAIGFFSDPGSAIVRPALVSAWGRRPHEVSRPGAEPKGMPPRTETVRSWLRSSPLFAKTSEVELSRIASLADELHVEPGEQLTVEGQPGTTFMVIARGTATVTRGGRRLVGLGPGSYFGEIALLEQGPRTATVTADSRMWLFVFDAKGFASLMNGIPAVADEIFRALAERKRNARGDG
jgi:SAM-dependent methyltransferase